MPEGPQPEDQRARERARALVGRTLDGRYRIDAVLAMGGMGAVYDARHVKLQKRVALKLLHPDVEADSELVRRFEREALAGGLIAHPHVACATDFGELADGTRFLVMELVRGETLRDLLGREGPLAPAQAARLARQIAVGLGAIHDRGVVHRDLKPRNVMVTPEGFVKIVDFGLAKVDAARVSTMSEEDVAQDARLTAGGVVFGTFGHLAPEAALGMESVDARSDLYALGVMTYEMLAGCHPFEASSEIELFAKQRRLTAPPIASRAPATEVPAALEAVVLRLLEREPEARFASAREVVIAIDEAEPSASKVPPAPLLSDEAPLASVRAEVVAAGPAAGRTGTPPAVADAGPEGAPPPEAPPLEEEGGPPSGETTSRSQLGLLLAGVGVVAVATLVAVIAVAC